MRASRGTATFFLLAASYRFCGDREAGREQVELGSSPKHERRVQEGREPREKKGRERVVGKAAGDECVFISCTGAGGDLLASPYLRRSRGSSSEICKSSS
jgi:hypothetical protein